MSNRLDDVAFMNGLKLRPSRPVIYIAGKMRGLEDYGRAHFEAAEKMLTALGFIVLNPSTLPIGMADHKYLPICMAMLEAADCVLLLNNWADSKGATAEYHYAICQGKAIIYEDADPEERTKDGSEETKAGDGA